MDGINELTTSQSIRARWYDMYLFLISALECDYRKYPDRGVYNWAIGMIKECTDVIKGTEEFKSN